MPVSDKEAADRYARAIGQAQKVLAAWVADHDSRISAEQAANTVLGILDSRDLVQMQVARGDLPPRGGNPTDPGSKTPNVSSMTSIAAALPIPAEP